MGKPLKETGFGKALWAAGDALKGKGKVGKVLDGALEIAPIPNPIRIGKELTQKKEIKKIKDNPELASRLSDAGVDVSKLLDDSPSWVVPTLAFVTLVGALYLVATGNLDPAYLVEIAKTIFGV